MDLLNNINFNEQESILYFLYGFRNFISSKDLMDEIRLYMINYKDEERKK